MRTAVLLATVLLSFVAVLAGGTEDALSEITPADLDFLTGAWSGTDGNGSWETVYSSSKGGQIIGASKEFRGDRVAMIDFEHFYVRENKLRMTPFPFGKRSVEFTLTRFDATSRIAVFENPDHDFPKKFIYRAGGKDALTIELSGQMSDSAVELAIEFKRQ